MKRFIVTAGMVTILLAANVQAQQVKTVNTSCSNKSWEFVCTESNNYLNKLLTNGWLKYVSNNSSNTAANCQNNKCDNTTTNSQNNKCDNTTTNCQNNKNDNTAANCPNNKCDSTTTEQNNKKPTETTTEATTESTTETTTSDGVQKPSNNSQSNNQNNNQSSNQNNSQNSNQSSNQNNTQNNTQSQSMEEQVVALVNQYRAQYGLKALKINPSVSKVAQAKSEDMRDKNYFDHTSPTYGSPFNMLKSFGISYKTAGENIAKGQKTAQAVVDAWMNSEGHRANILNANFEEIGVGYATSGSTTYWTQLFITQ